MKTSCWCTSKLSFQFLLSCVSPNRVCQEVKKEKKNPSDSKPEGPNSKAIKCK